MLYFLLEEKEVDIKLAVAAGSMTTNLNVECSQRLSQSVVQCQVFIVVAINTENLDNNGGISNYLWMAQTKENLCFIHACFC